VADCPPDEVLLGLGFPAGGNEEIREHLKTCAKCRAKLAAIKHVMPLPPVNPPPPIAVTFKEPEPVSEAPAVTIRPTGDEDS
jgi:hypothetical protein